MTKYMIFEINHILHRFLISRDFKWTKYKN